MTFQNFPELSATFQNFQRLKVLILSYKEQVKRKNSNIQYFTLVYTFYNNILKQYSLSSDLEKEKAKNHERRKTFKKTNKWKSPEQIIQGNTQHSVQRNNSC